ncbi:hypothetical protein [Pedobacter sp. ASV28]|uniref:hypothetical protein n=1 Tax=Pedobacter sp. ASV28 TaxID=2795123 RepID=UPI0018EACA16|nr:hypothetical protein [Pedobacter sp. ASV28]
MTKVVNRMLKAGALYFSIVITFIIAIISAALIMLVAHYRNGYLKDLRYQRLLNNLNSGVAYALADRTNLDYTKTIDLYGQETDSLVIGRKLWGIYELAQLQVFIFQDTIKKSFLIGTEPDSVALYLSDEDRPISISGNTKIVGNVLLPKSGIRQSYAEGKPYTGDQLIYKGTIGNSERILPPLKKEILAKLTSNFEEGGKGKWPILKHKRLKVSFLDSTQYINLPKVAILQDVELEGNMVLYADSVVTISASAQLNGIQLYAPIIKVEKGFKGNCQLFASDSIIVANQTIFTYPSALGIIKMEHSVDQPQISLGDEVQFNGIIFSYEEKRSLMQTLIALGKNTQVKGEVYSTGLLKLEKEVSIIGKTSCNRFIMRTPTTLYENFLIDVNFNRKARSSYYLSSRLFDDKRKNQVLKWVE